jgi:hypothetical protein
MSGVTYASNETLTEGASASINLSGSNDTLYMANGDYVGLLAGNNDTVNLSSGSVDTLNMNTVSSFLLNGSNDTVGAGTDVQVNVNGSNDALFMSNGDYVGLLAGNDDTVILSDGLVDTLNNVTDIILEGSNDTVGVGSGGQINVDGSNDGLFMANGDYVGLLAGGNNAVYLSSGSIQIISGQSGIAVTGSDDTITTGTSVSLSLIGSSNILAMGTLGSLSLISGGNDTITMSGGTISIASGQSGISVTGSSDTITTGTSVSLVVAVGGDTITMGTLGSLSLVSGGNDAVTMSNGTLSISSGQSGLSVTGSNDTITTGTSDSMNLFSGANTLTMGTLGYVGLISGANDTINMSDGSSLILSNVTNATFNGSSDAIYINGSNVSIIVDGSNDTVNAVASDGVTVISVIGNNDAVSMGTNSYVDNIVGSNDTVTAGTGSYVGLIEGNADSVNMSGGSVVALSNVTNATVNGSSDSIDVAGSNVSVNVNGSGDTVTDGYSGDVISVNGSGDVIYAAEGSTVTLNAGDTGDTINMIGGTIVLGAGVSGITINGTGDTFSGAGAGLQGPVYTTTVEKVGAGGVLIPITTTHTPAVIYYAGDIPDLVSYFEANPYLSQSQIQAAESDSNYTTNLDTYLSSANVYGSSNSLPSNVLAMLDGYSSIYLALTGVPAVELSEETYIEQQVGWAASNYPMPATLPVSGVSEGVGTILQNLMPALESTNSNTQSLVSEAIGLLEYGNAGAPAGNQTPMLSDATAEMLLAIAETPGFTAATQSSAEVYTPGRSGHWEIVVNGNGTYTQTYKSPPLIETVLSDFDSYVAPIIDIAAVLTLNPEFIAATGLSAAVATGVQVAATAVNLVQAGQDFAAGDDLQGVLGVAAAVGSVLSSIGSAEQQANYAAEEAGGAEILDNTANVASALGEGLSYGSAIAQSIDGLATGNGTFLQALTNALGVVGGVAGLENDTTVQQFAALGQGLASTAQNGENGDVLAALTSFIQSANAYQNLGGISGIEQDAASLYSAFLGAEYSQGYEASLGDGNSTEIAASMQYADNSGYDINVPSLNLLSDAEPFFASQEEENGVNPDVGTVPTDNSGETVGIGVDLSAQNSVGLANDGVPQYIISLLTPYLGVGNANGTTIAYGPKGANVPNPSGLVLTTQEVNTLDSDVMGANLSGSGGTQGVEEQWANANPTESWTALPENTQIALFWLHYNGSLNNPAIPQSQILFQDAVSGNFGQAAIDLFTWAASSGNQNLIPPAQLILRDLADSGGAAPG